MSASVGARWDCDTIVYVYANENGENMFQTYVFHDAETRCADGAYVSLVNVL